jgi:hypothetical protein
MTSSPGGPKCRSGAFDKTDLYAGGEGRYRIFDIGVPYGGIPVPAATLDPSETAIYFVGHENGNSGGAGLLRLHKLEGPPGSETFTYGPTLGVAAPWAFWAGDPSDTSPLRPDFAPQLGSTQRLQTGDARIQNAQGAATPSVGP